MSATTPKKKLCWNCDGNVPLQAEHCPYCGVYIEHTADRADEEDQQEDLHAPPYAIPARTASEEAPASPFAAAKKAKTPQQPSAAASAPRAAAPRVEIRNTNSSEIRRVVMPLVFLLCGSVFALFGLVLLLFSDNGVFALKWNGDYWPFYLIAGTLALLGGWRLLGGLDETPS